MELDCLMFNLCGPVAAAIALAMSSPAEEVRREFHDTGELRSETIPPGGPGNADPGMYCRREYDKAGGLLREFWYRPGGREKSKTYYPGGSVHVYEETTHYEVSKRVVYSEDGEVLSSYEHTPNTVWIFDACAAAFVVAVSWYVAGVVRRWRKRGPDSSGGRRAQVDAAAPGQGDGGETE